MNRDIIQEGKVHLILYFVYDGSGNTFLSLFIHILNHSLTWEPEQNYWHIVDNFKQV